VVAKVRGVKHTNNITRGLSNVLDVSSTDEMFQLLVADRVDVVLTNYLDGKLRMQQYAEADIVHLRQPLSVLKLYHYLNIKHHALVPHIDQAIKRRLQSGELHLKIKQAERKIMQSMAPLNGAAILGPQYSSP